MIAPRTRLYLTIALAPLALAACKSEPVTPGGDTPKGETIAAIAPPAGKAWTEVVSQTPDGGYRMGNPEAPIKLVEYGALSCSHCAEFSHTASKELQAQFVASGRVSYELRFFMLNALDVPATLLATCGPPEAVITLADQFWEFQHIMFNNLKVNQAMFEQASQAVPNQRFGLIAKAGGMDQFFAARGIAAGQGATCLADVNKATGLVNATSKAGTEKGITGTPTFFLNGSKLDANTWPTVKAALQSAGAR